MSADGLRPFPGTQAFEELVRTLHTHKNLSQIVTSRVIPSAPEGVEREVITLPRLLSEAAAELLKTEHWPDRSSAKKVAGDVNCNAQILCILDGFVEQGIATPQVCWHVGAYDSAWLSFAVVLPCLDRKSWTLASM
jgi:hypothetical protein